MRYKKALFTVVVFFVVNIVSFNSPNKSAYAVNDPGIMCSELGIVVQDGLSGDYKANEQHDFVINLNNYSGDKTKDHKVKSFESTHDLNVFSFCSSTWAWMDSTSGEVNTYCTEGDALTTGSVRYAYLYEKGFTDMLGFHKPICRLGSYDVVSGLSCEDIQVYQVRELPDPDNPGSTKNFFCYAPGCIDAVNHVHVSGKVFEDGSPYTNSISVRFVGAGGNDDFSVSTDSDGSFTSDHGSFGSNGSTDMTVEKLSGANFCKKNNIVVSASCSPESCLSDALPSGETTVDTPFDICAQITDSALRVKCNACQGADGDNIWTAFGCIPTKLESIIGSIITIGLMSSGGIALLMILISGFLLSISQGNPEQVGKARDLLVSAVVGLLFVIFSTTILQFIGHDILRIPGFGN